MAADADKIISLNVGGVKFATSLETLTRDPESMLARMFQGDIGKRRDDKGRIFIDRDSKHFGLILNYLRDGTCVLPQDAQQLKEILQEAEFYVLDDIKTLITSTGIVTTSNQHNSAQQLRQMISDNLMEDALLRETVDLVLACAYGWGPGNTLRQVPSRAACVVVSLNETACSPLFPRHPPSRDETLYVYFQQSIRFEGPVQQEVYSRKHETDLIHEDGMSYNPRTYGCSDSQRFHIKTQQVYRKHCIDDLAAYPKRLRECALHTLANPNALQWALEMCGFKEANISMKESVLDQSPDGSSQAVISRLTCYISLTL
ncbi:hypothetical protein WJX84_006001 [Apatococcus fuscideae]|uniref:BTB domain-containing protein n=1 Tax=Apatococcus fuscideae TaxID=2026836 RepID=A0AAW1SRZ9_9CHLO